VQEVAHGLAVDHALQQMKLSHEIPKSRVECRGEPGLGAREQNLNWSTLVRLARSAGVVDRSGHFFAPREVLAKAVGHALRD